MLDVKFITAFKRSCKLMKKRGYDLSLLDEVIDQLRQGKPLDEKYRDDNLLTLTLVNTSSHSDIFKM